jgi:toxin ParE1/3/4
MAFPAETEKVRSPMKVELTPDAAQWVGYSVESGRFATPEDAVRFAVNEAKRAELRALLDASEAEGGEHSSDDMRRFVREHLDRLGQTKTSA